MYENFRDLIAQWPSLTVLANEAGAKWSTVSKWNQRDNIPPAWWPTLVTISEKRGVKGVTYEALARLAIARSGERAA